MGTRAWKKFKQLDDNSNGFLEGKEVWALAEWVWKSFHKGKAPSAEVMTAVDGEVCMAHLMCNGQMCEREAQKILHRCDKNGDGRIGEEEFEAYYVQTTEVLGRGCGEMGRSAEVAVACGMEGNYGIPQEQEGKTRP